MRKDARDDGVGLRVPSDLDRSICSYDALSGSNREKFDRASFWFSASRRMCDVSITAAFAALVSAIESLTSSGEVHQFTCPVCSGVTDHRVPGPTKLFKDFLATYALGATLAKDRDDMYDLRSDLVHGEHLVELDREIPIMGWTPPGFKKKNANSITTSGDLLARRCETGSRRPRGKHTPFYCRFAGKSVSSENEVSARSECLSHLLRCGPQCS